MINIITYTTTCYLLSVFVTYLCFKKAIYDVKKNHTLLSSVNSQVALIQLKKAIYSVILYTYIIVTLVGILLFTTVDCRTKEIIQENQIKLESYLNGESDAL
jgi:hypothetical protein